MSCFWRKGEYCNNSINNKIQDCTTNYTIFTTTHYYTSFCMRNKHVIILTCILPVASEAHSNTSSIVLWTSACLPGFFHDQQVFKIHLISCRYYFLNKTNKIDLSIDDVWVFYSFMPPKRYSHAAVWWLAYWWCVGCVVMHDAAASSPSSHSTFSAWSTTPNTETGRLHRTLGRGPCGRRSSIGRV